MVRHPNRRRYLRNAYLNSACDPIGFGANLVSPALPRPEDYLNHLSVSQYYVNKRQNYRSSFQNGYELWAANCLQEYFTPPRMAPVPGDQDYDEDDHKTSVEEPIDPYDQTTVNTLVARGTHKRFYRRNGGIYSELRQRDVSDIYTRGDPRENQVHVVVTTLDRSGKNAMLVQKFSKARSAMVDIALVIDIPGPGSETFTRENGGGWWGTARETEKLLAVSCRLHMQRGGNGLGFLYGLVTGGTRVRFFKWTVDKKEDIGGRFEDLAVLLGITDDEEDYDSYSDLSDAEPDPSSNDFASPGEDVLNLDSSNLALCKGKGKATESENNINAEATTQSTDGGSSAPSPPHNTSQSYQPDPEDLFDIRLPPETDRGGYYDILWQGEKCRIMFHHIGSVKL